MINNNGFNQVFYAQLKTKIEKQYSFLRKEKQAKTQEQVIIKLFNDVLNMTNNDILITKRKILFNVIFSNFCLLVNEILNYQKETFRDLSNYIINFFRTFLINKKYLFTNSNYSKILLLYFKFIQFYPQLNKDTFTLHNDFFLQLK